MFQILQSDPSAEGLSVKKQLINELISLKSTNIQGLENDSLQRCLHYVLKISIFFFFSSKSLYRVPCVCSPSVIFDILFEEGVLKPSTIHLPHFFSLFSPCTELLSAVNKVKIKPQTRSILPERQG